MSASSTSSRKPFDSHHLPVVTDLSETTKARLEAIKLSKEAEMRAKHEQQKRREKEAKELRERQNSEKKKQMHSHHVELTKRVKGATSKISDLIKRDRQLGRSMSDSADHTDDAFFVETKVRKEYEHLEHDDDVDRADRPRSLRKMDKKRSFKVETLKSTVAHLEVADNLLSYVKQPGTETLARPEEDTASPSAESTAAKIAQIRAQCEEALGVTKFERLYATLKGCSGLDNEERVIEGLLVEMGPAEHLLAKLLLLLNLEERASRSPTKV